MPADDQTLAASAAALGAVLRARGQRLACAESCTGGWIGKLLTDIPGSSVWFERGIVSYSNAAKETLLGVPAALLAQHGAVSEAVVRAMAEGLRRRAPVDWTLAVSGIAGPGGGSADKPVGRVWTAWAGARTTDAQAFDFDGDREAVRRAAVAAALDGLCARLG